jgi:DNA-binding NarL/FixJ family response regulator
MPTAPITVLLAEDHLVVRQGLVSLLRLDGRFTVVAEAQNGREAVELTRTLRPDVVLMDIAMPVLNGLEATRQILGENPSARVVILSAHSDDEYIDRMIAAGVAGFLEKQTSAEILARGLREVAQGRTFFSPSISRRLALRADLPRNRDGMVRAHATRLTSRESEVLQLVAEGFANKQIAAHLCISVKTVEKHRQHLMDKLGIHETAGLTRYAIATGVVDRQVRLTIV